MSPVTAPPLLNREYLSIGDKGGVLLVEHFGDTLTDSEKESMTDVALRLYMMGCVAKATRLEITDMRLLEPDPGPIELEDEWETPGFVVVAGAVVVAMCILLLVLVLR